MEKYIINKNTLAILQDKNKSIIFEKYVSYELEKLPKDIINESCMYYGSSLKGRIDSTNYLLGIKYKCPIIISEKKDIIFFPTLSIKNDQCSWFNYNGIKKYFTDNNDIFNIILANDKIIKINLSNNVFNNQFFKASRLESILRNNCK